MHSIGGHINDSLLDVDTRARRSGSTLLDFLLEHRVFAREGTGKNNEALNAVFRVSWLVVKLTTTWSSNEMFLSTRDPSRLREVSAGKIGLSNVILRRREFFLRSKFKIFSFLFRERWIYETIGKHEFGLKKSGKTIRFNPELRVTVPTIELSLLKPHPPHA